MKSDKLFWGIFLVFIGGIFLLENFDLIDFHWRHVWKFWPVLLILGGVNVLFGRSKSNLGVIITAIITILVLGLLTYKGLESKQETDNFSWSFDDENKDQEINLKTANTYAELYSDATKSARLEIKGGACKFQLRTSTDKLFMAQAEGPSNDFYILKTTQKDSSANVLFRSKYKSQIFNSDDLGNVKMYLNANPVWDIHLIMGAGKANFDLTAFKVKNLYVKGGAAEFNIKLGSQSPNVTLYTETGVADLNIDVPEASGCRIKVATGLSSKNLNGFDKKNDNIYETENYVTASNKINITLKSGLSDIDINRY